MGLYLILNGKILIKKSKIHNPYELISRSYNMHPGLNLNNLKYFYDAVECQSISEASRKNFITQSAVSQGILKLERGLQVDLITHQRNCFKLTVEGEQIYQLTRQLFGTLKAMQDVAHEQSEGISGQINLTCTQSIAMNLLSNIFQSMQQLHPQITVRLKLSKMDQICLMLKKGLMDMGIVVESDICESFQKEEIQKGHFHLYSKSGAIGQGIYVDHSNGLFVNRLGELYRKRFKKDMVILQELDSWQVLAQCAFQGIGCCFLPDFIASKDPSLKICKNIEPIPYRIIALYPQGARLTRASKALINLLRIS